MQNILKDSVRTAQYKTLLPGFKSKSVKAAQKNNPLTKNKCKRINKLHGQNVFFCFVFGPTAPPPDWAMVSSFTRFLDHTQRSTTHSRQASMPPVGFKPTISAGERPQTHALDRAGTGTGMGRM